MRFCCISDLHGFLPDLSHLDFDCLLIGGDICPVRDHSLYYQSQFLNTKFRQWLERIARPVIAVAGNHDLVFERAPQLVPELPWTYLQDSETMPGNGLKIYGSPWQPNFGVGWAFNATEAELCQRWAMIPEDTDVLLLHGPPHGYGDLSPYGSVHTGSPGLLKRIEDVKPKLAVAGHIHDGYGRYHIGETVFLNASLVDERYRLTNAPIIVEV